MDERLVMVNHRAYGIWDWPDISIGDLACGINDAARRDGDCPHQAPFVILTLKDGEPNVLGPLRGPYCRDHAKDIIAANERYLAERAERYRHIEQRRHR
jgi:hypothetical protein